MVSDLFDFLLALVDEHQLVGNRLVLAFVFDGEVPDADSVVLTGDCYD